MKSKGILEEKLKTYYEDSDVSNYRYILSEFLENYEGFNFDTVLDIGAGIGSFYDANKHLNFNYFALESSEYGLSALKSKGINTTSFFLNINNRLPFDDNSLSGVLFNQVIEHLDKKIGEYYIGEIVRVLEPGGVAIIKSPSRYSTIWNTDPHHIYCWTPRELHNEVVKYEKSLQVIKIQKIILEPWMLSNYNENIINIWHKNNEYPRIKKLFNIVGKIVSKVNDYYPKTDKIYAASNITFVKNT